MSMPRPSLPQTPPARRARTWGVLAAAVALASTPLGCSNDADPINEEDLDARGDDEREDEGALTDGEVAHALFTANVGELAQANAALPRLQSQAARDFGLRMANAHTRNNEELESLAEDRDIRLFDNDVSAALRADASVIVNDLRAAPESALDALYMQAQVDTHALTASLLTDELIPEANDEVLRDFLADTRATVEEHLVEAEEILQELGPPSGG